MPTDEEKELLRKLTETNKIAAFGMTLGMDERSAAMPSQNSRGDTVTWDGLLQVKLPTARLSPPTIRRLSSL